MPKPSEYWSEELAHSSGKPDANLATDALQLGGIEAEDYATKKYVQDFHNNKEELLKQYIDSQDLAKLQAAKDYVDTMIRNQDFSMFAKVTDLQTLSQTLSARIEACKAECQQEMNTRINAVVQDVNGAINQLNTRTSELFTSVSNGKDLVADAITDKGIHTSATDSFSTMATNIRNIQTEGGGEYDENFVNTADGNITANDVALGKIGYSKGNKIIGSHQDLDTSDATATAYDILEGKTAYSNGQKITGTRMETQYPTYGTDTTNATVTAGDIALGKTAYAGGAYITGTANPVSNPEVEEIYATSSNDYDINIGDIGLVKYPDTEDTVVSRTNISFSKDGNYCVSTVKLNDLSSTVEYIESHRVNVDGLIVQASAGISGGINYKKYRYTKAELGIDTDEVINDIQFGAAGFLGYNDRCLLVIKTLKTITDGSATTYQRFLHFYTFHLNDNGVIGKEYEGEPYVVNGYKIQYSTSSTETINGFIFTNTDPNVFISLRTYYNGNNILAAKRNSITPIMNDGKVNLNVFFGAEVIAGGDSIKEPSITKLHITADDKFITAGSSRYNSTGSIIVLDENLYPQPSKYYPSFNIRGGLVYSATYNVLIDTLGLTASTIGSLSLYEPGAPYDGSMSGGSPSWNIIKTVNFDISSNHSGIGLCLITPDNTRLIVATSTYTGDPPHSMSFANIKIYVFNLTDIINASNGDTIVPIQSSDLYSVNAGSCAFSLPVKISTNPSGTIIHIYHDTKDSQKAELWTLTTDASQDLVAVRYKNQYFQKSTEV